jgi:hypothetical protein
MLEYLDYPSLVKVAVSKNDAALTLVLRQDIVSRWKRLFSLVCQERYQQDKDVFRFRDFEEEEYRRRKKDTKRQWVLLERSQKRMGPVKWEQHCQAHKREL